MLENNLKVEGDLGEMVTTVHMAFITDGDLCLCLTALISNHCPSEENIIYYYFGQRMPFKLSCFNMLHNI